MNCYVRNVNRALISRGTIILTLLVLTPEMFVRGWKDVKFHDFCITSP